jgi:hypothetical protein
MNLDLPFGQHKEDDDDNATAGEPAPKSPKKAISFCEFCGRKGHVTTKSKKCIAIPGAGKKYCSRDSGTLLTEPQQQIEANHMESTADDSLDCDNFDAMPLVVVPGEELFFDVDAGMDTAAAALTEAWNNADSDDDESVQLARGII